jgi:hypothetical protein
MLKITKVKFMNKHYENRMNSKLAGIGSQATFDCPATFAVACLAQAVFVDLKEFKIITS